MRAQACTGSTREHRQYEIESLARSLAWRRRQANRIMKLKCLKTIVLAIPLFVRGKTILRFWSSRYAKAVDLVSGVWLLMAFDRETAALIRRSNDDTVMDAMAPESAGVQNRRIISSLLTL